MPQATIKDLGPCTITWDGVDLGKSFGGVVFRDGMTKQAVMEDQLGTTPVDHIITGRQCSVDVPMSRTTLAQLAKVMPGASSGGSFVRVRNLTGIACASLAKKLVLAPLVDGSASSDKLTIFLAYPTPEIELTFNNESQRVYKVVFNAYPDQTAGNRMYQIGGTP